MPLDELLAWMPAGDPDAALARQGDARQDLLDRIVEDMSTAALIDLPEEATVTRLRLGALAMLAAGHDVPAAAEQTGLSPDEVAIGWALGDTTAGLTAARSRKSWASWRRPRRGGRRRKGTPSPAPIVRPTGSPSRWSR